MPPLRGKKKEKKKKKKKKAKKKRKDTSECRVCQHIVGNPNQLSIRGREIVY